MYSTLMRVRVELRRRNGIFLPRFKPQTGTKGQLKLVREEVHGRPTSILCLYPEQTQYTVRMAPFGDDEDVQAAHRMALFEARITYVDEDQLRFLGFETAVNRAWVVQEWDVFLLKV